MPPNLGASFMRALSSLPSGGGPKPRFATGSDVGTLDPSRPADTDPRSMAGDKILIDPGMVASGAGKVRPGDELNILAEVVSVGDKIVLTPLEVSTNNPDKRDDFESGSHGMGNERTAPGDRTQGTEIDGAQ